MFDLNSSFKEHYTNQNSLVTMEAISLLVHEKNWTHLSWERAPPCGL